MCSSTVIWHFLMCISSKCFLKIKAVYSLLILMCNLFFSLIYPSTLSLLREIISTFHFSRNLNTLFCRHITVLFPSSKLLWKFFCDDRHSLSEAISLINSLSFINYIIVALLLLLLLSKEKGNCRRSEVRHSAVYCSETLHVLEATERDKDLG